MEYLKFSSNHCRFLRPLSSPQAKTSVRAECQYFLKLLWSTREYNINYSKDVFSLYLFWNLPNICQFNRKLAVAVFYIWWQARPQYSPDVILWSRFPSAHLGWHLQLFQYDIAHTERNWEFREKIRKREKSKVCITIVNFQ